MANADKGDLRAEFLELSDAADAAFLGACELESLAESHAFDKDFYLTEAARLAFACGVIRQHAHAMFDRG